MFILGISCYYHDSSAALLKDGIVIAAAEEERFTRKKHDHSFPLYSIQYCLKKAGITIQEIDHVAFYEKPFLKFERLLYQHLHSFPLSFKTWLTSTPSWINEKLRLPKTLKKKLKYKGDIFFIDHHLSHAASTFLVSPFQEATIVTIDGVGEWLTTTIGHGKGTDIHLSHGLHFPHSVGLLYSTVTAYLGFSVNNSEYKVMGLAAYGEMDRSRNHFYQKLKQTLDLKSDGSFHFDMSYFKFHYSSRMPTSKFCKLLGGPVSPRDAKMTQRHKDISAAVQLLTEDIVTKILHHAHSLHPSKNIVIAGGVALNSVFNGKILKATPFQNIWIQPNASDGGTSIGAASFAYHSILGHPRNFHQKDAFLGPSFSSSEIQIFLNEHNIIHSKFQNQSDLISKTAQMIHKNQVVSWFQKGLEWGPRALGARSILASPCNSEAKELLNAKVKHREKFRPFAPVVCADDAPTFFECDDPVPEPTDFMLMVYPVKPQWQNQIPSVTHVDGSGRLQTIRKEQNPLYHDLIKQFGKLSGIPILINTSFNIRGEPIVTTPLDAFKCMMGTGIDCLVMDQFLIKRADNPSHIWDSESLATD